MTIVVKGYGGYISTRRISGHRIPQHVQNLVVREYARRKGLEFKLSATEHASTACYLILEEVLADLSNLDGVIAYSLYMLPRDKARRLGVYNTIIDNCCRLFLAVEDFEVSKESDIERVETIWKIQEITDSQSNELLDNFSVIEKVTNEINNLENQKG